MVRLYEPPSWIGLSPADYSKFLTRKAAALRRRDAKRGGTYSLVEAKQAIYKAFCESDGLDPYDGLPMDPSLIGAYDNESSKLERAGYKKRFSRLPTIDHINGEPVAEFMVLSWQTNDAKGDMSPEEYINHCRAVVARWG